MSYLRCDERLSSIDVDVDVDVVVAVVDGYEPAKQLDNQSFRYVKLLKSLTCYY